MSSFGQYVDGKTIAIVGPAPAPYDQTAEVDAHDIVYRTSWGFSAPLKKAIRHSSHAERGGDWFRDDVFPAGYGTRVDMAFYNAGASDQMARGELDHIIRHLDWTVCKRAGMQPSGLTNVRSSNKPPMKLPGTENQVTAMLWDLTFYRPASVTVFGADFYTGDFEDWYDPSYVPTELWADADHLRESSRALVWHDMADNRRVCKLVDDLGWIAGDARYLKALRMPYEEYNAILEAQMQRVHAVQGSA
jgi:hypothetical protein